MKYDIFAGMSGGFGGATYQTTEEFDTKEQATEAAYTIACEIFDQYAGLYGVRNWTECMNEAIESIPEEDCEDMEDYSNALEEYADELYNEEKESWIDYYVIKSKEQ